MRCMSRLFHGKLMERCANDFWRSSATDYRVTDSQQKTDIRILNNSCMVNNQQPSASTTMHSDYVKKHINGAKHEKSLRPSPHSRLGGGFDSPALVGRAVKVGCPITNEGSKVLVQANELGLVFSPVINPAGQRAQTDGTDALMPALLDQAFRGEL